MHFKKIGVFAAVLMVAVTAAIAEVPSRINFQGRLLDQNKNPDPGFSIWCLRCGIPVREREDPRFGLKHRIMSR